MSARLYTFPPRGPLAELGAQIAHYRAMAFATGSPLHWRLVRALEAKRAIIVGAAPPPLRFT
jgi:hypothetical protein